MDLPKVNIAVIGVVCSSLGGMVWYASEQASIISNLEATVSVLNAESNTTDKVNMVRDIEQNKMNIEEMIDILAEFYEDMEDSDNEIWEEIDQIHEDLGGMAQHMMAIVKLQARIKTLENTIEYLTRRPINSDGM